MLKISLLKSQHIFIHVICYFFHAMYTEYRKVYIKSQTNILIKYGFAVLESK